MSACSVLLQFHSAPPHCLLATCTASTEVASHLPVRTVSHLVLRPLLARQFRSYWSYLAFATMCSVYSHSRNLQRVLSQTWASAVPESSTRRKPAACLESREEEREKSGTAGEREARARWHLSPSSAHSSYSTFLRLDQKHRITCVFVCGGGVRQEADVWRVGRDLKEAMAAA